MEKNGKLWKMACIVFAASLLLGTLAANLTGKNGQGSWELYFTQVGDALKQQDFARESYFFYVLRLRLMEVGAIWLLSMTAFGSVSLWASMGWLGFTAGVRISLGTMVFGRTGILYFLCSILPQALFYVPALILLYARGFQIYSFMRKQKDWGQYRRIRMPKDILLLLITLLCLLPGIICECYINPLLLKVYF
ncbi:stage II sporulation protein M [Qiania dongpingensis]|uniref:Stage II sporulation protein M n=1 Tax=Qiania dongpingensis TaxID=2763669 RepID=A0A7G9G5I1_9FIRM|nr:stage II sporulation protein M [Qiania dongpingensis]QNM06063.1 stage II sporulation protein M [Qiania dongpingensis]